MSDTQTLIDFDRAYSVDGYPGVAWWAIRYDTEQVMPDDPDCWSDDPADYTEVNYDMLVMRMIGDDRDFLIDVQDVSAISDDDYCDGCGQIGCGWHS